MRRSEIPTVASCTRPVSKSRGEWRCSSAAAARGNFQELQGGRAEDWGERTHRGFPASSRGNFLRLLQRFNAGAIRDPGRIGGINVSLEGGSE